MFLNSRAFRPLYAAFALWVWAIPGLAQTSLPAAPAAAVPPATAPPSTVPPAAAPPITDPPAGPVIGHSTAPVEVPPVAKLPPRPFTWTPLKLELPTSIQMYAGDAVNIDGEPLKAWYASIDYTDRSLLAKSLFSTTPTARETTSSLARKANALLTINGGYFDMKGVPSATLSVVISGGQLLAPATPKATRPNGVYHLTRGAFGVRADRSFDIAWVAHPEGETYAYPTPLPNAYNSIAPPPTKTFPAGGKPWNMVEAIGGGPVLVKNGDIRLTSSEELFAGSMTTSRHPRTAIGFGQSGRLVFFLVDGRQPTHSMGMTLPELAQTMKELGCVEALNLDGGGSSAFVVRGVTLNKPSDGPERNVTSAFAIVPDPNLRAIDR